MKIMQSRRPAVEEDWVQWRKMNSGEWRVKSVCFVRFVASVGKSHNDYSTIVQKWKLMHYPHLCSPTSTDCSRQSSSPPRPAAEARSPSPWPSPAPSPPLQHFRTASTFARDRRAEQWWWECRFTILSATEGSGRELLNSAGKGSPLLKCDVSIGTLPK